MDARRFSTIAHRSHLILNPIAGEAADRALEAMELTPGTRALDAGCGKGELLLRLVRRRDAHGTGVDLNPDFLAAGRAHAAARPGPGTIELIEGDARAYTAACAVDSLDAALCVGATQVFGTLGDTLDALARVVRRGGYVLVGEGYWKRDPDAGYLAALKASTSDLLDHAGHLALATRRGWTPVFSAEASERDWDAYENAYAENIERHAASNPQDPDREAMLTRIRAWRESYQRWGRATLGFAIDVFRR